MTEQELTSNEVSNRIGLACFLSLIGLVGLIANGFLLVAIFCKWRELPFSKCIMTQSVTNIMICVIVVPYSVMYEYHLVQRPISCAVLEYMRHFLCLFSNVFLCATAALCFCYIRYSKFQTTTEAKFIQAMILATLLSILLASLSPTVYLPGLAANLEGGGRKDQRYNVSVDVIIGNDDITADDVIGGTAVELPPLRFDAAEEGAFCQFSTRVIGSRAAMAYEVVLFVVFILTTYISMLFFALTFLQLSNENTNQNADTKNADANASKKKANSIRKNANPSNTNGNSSKNKNGNSSKSTNDNSSNQIDKSVNSRNRNSFSTNKNSFHKNGDGGFDRNDNASQGHGKGNDPQLVAVSPVHSSLSPLNALEVVDVCRRLSVVCMLVAFCWVFVCVEVFGHFGLLTLRYFFLLPVVFYPLVIVLGNDKLFGDVSPTRDLSHQQRHDAMPLTDLFRDTIVPKTAPSRLRSSMDQNPETNRDKRNADRPMTDLLRGDTHLKTVPSTSSKGHPTNLKLEGERRDEHQGGVDTQNVQPKRSSDSQKEKIQTTDKNLKMEGEKNDVGMFGTNLENMQPQRRSDPSKDHKPSVDGQLKTDEKQEGDLSGIHTETSQSEKCSDPVTENRLPPDRKPKMEEEEKTGGDPENWPLVKRSGSLTKKKPRKRENLRRHSMQIQEAEHERMLILLEKEKQKNFKPLIVQHDYEKIKKLAQKSESESSSCQEDTVRDGTEERRIRQNTDSNLQNTDSNLQNTDSNLQNTDSSLQNTDSNLQNTDSNLQNTDSNLQNTDSNLQNTDSNLQNTDSSLQNTDSSLQNTDSSLQNTDSSLQNTDSSSSSTELLVMDYVTEETSGTEKLSAVRKERVHQCFKLPDKPRQQSVIIQELPQSPSISLEDNSLESHPSHTETL